MDLLVLLFPALPALRLSLHWVLVGIDESRVCFKDIVNHGCRLSHLAQNLKVVRGIEVARVQSLIVVLVGEQRHAFVMGFFFYFSLMCCLVWSSSLFLCVVVGGVCDVNVCTLLYLLEW